jgi:tRNA pseudouridine32 synthase / 23S rRNA pseudouridine746 synthase
MTPEEIVSRLLYRDGLMLIIDKPAGVAVHKGPKGGPSLEDDFPALQFGLPKPPALAHRLDRETSGCLVLGRHRKALANLSDLFRHGKVGKTYWAVVEGGPAEPEGRIDLALSKLDDNRGWWMKADPDGLPSSTTWNVLGRSEHALSGPSPLEGEGVDRPSSNDVNNRPRRLTWLALEPLTGRTHQLRVHCAAMKWPIVGDPIYGTAPRTGGPRLHLHAREVTVPLYKNREPIKTTAPVPAHMHERLKACGWNGEEPRVPDAMQRHSAS